MNLADILTTLTHEHGRDILKNQWQVMGLIADRYPEAKREQNLIEVIYKAGVVEDLMRDSEAHTQRYLLQKLKDVYLINEASAEEAVQAVCEALKLPISISKSSEKSASTTIAGRFVDNQDGTAFDKGTGLTWMRAPYRVSWDSRNKRFRGNPTLLTFYEATEEFGEGVVIRDFADSQEFKDYLLGFHKTYCSSSYSHKQPTSRWRLPTFFELYSLCHMRRESSGAWYSQLGKKFEVSETKADDCKDLCWWGYTKDDYLYYYRQIFDFGDYNETWLWASNGHLRFLKYNFLLNKISSEMAWVASIEGFPDGWGVEYCKNKYAVLLVAE